MLPKVGDIIELISMDNDPNPIEAGDTGEVESVSSMGPGEYQIQVDWESGRRLHLLYPQDKFRIIKVKED